MGSFLRAKRALVARAMGVDPSDAEDVLINPWQWTCPCCPPVEATLGPAPDTVGGRKVLRLSRAFNLAKMTSHMKEKHLRRAQRDLTDIVGGDPAHRTKVAEVRMYEAFVAIMSGEARTQSTPFPVISA